MSAPKAGADFWRQDAACAGKDPELFFPPRSNSIAAHQAQAVCKTCPVQRQCLAWAVETRVEFGVWGGTTEASRRRMGIKPKQGGARKLKPCGTRAAYDRHVKRGEVICDDCREQNRIRQAERRARIKEAKAAGRRRAEDALAS